MCEVTCTVLLLNQERIRGILHVLCADTNRPLQLRCIRTKVNDCAALIHIDAGSHVRVAVPEQLLI